MTDPVRRPRHALSLAALGWILGVTSTLAFVPIALANLGFVRDDWNHYVNMRDLHTRLEWWDALSALASNAWFGAHELRVFFGSFVVHYLLAPMGPAAEVASYLWILVLHAGAALLAGWILWRLLRSQLLALSAMVLLTYWPVASQPTLWINNLFFVQPWFFYLLTIAVVVRFWDRPVVVAVVASLTGVAAVFSGEAIIPLLLGSLALLPVVTWVRTRSSRRTGWALLPVAVVSSSLCAYLAWVVVWPESKGLDVGRLATFGDYLAGARQQFLNLADPRSSLYGSGSVGPDARVLVSTLFITALVACAIAVSGSARRSPRWRLRAALAGSLCGALTLSVIPWAVGVVTGSRPGPDLRYLYVPASLIVLIFVLIIDSIAASRPRWAAAVGKSVIIAVSAFAIYTTVLNVIVVWGYQRAVDERIWTEVDALLGPSTRAIITYHPDHPYLMAPYHSNAISDFQADWGVAGRIAWEQPSWPRMGLYRDADVVDGQVVARHYYDSATTCLSTAQSGEVIYIAYEYGPTLRDLLTSPLLVTSHVDEFLTARDSMRARALNPQPIDPWVPCEPMP